MEKDKILEFLEKYDFKYSSNNEEITVNLDFAQKVFIDFSQPNKIIISDKLTGWNFLTGIVEMSLRAAMVYNFIGAFILALFFMTLHFINAEILFIPFYLLYIMWVLMFSGYYLVKLEGFKSHIKYLI